MSAKLSKAKLVEAGKNEDIERVKFLLNHKPRHPNRNAALRLSSEKGHIEIVKILLDHKADIHNDHDIALRLSSYDGHAEVVKILLDHKADVQSNYNYALRWSSHYGHTEIVKMLLDSKADVHIRNDWALRFSSFHGHTEVVKLLILYGANNSDITNIDPEHIHPRRLMELFYIYQRLCQHECTIGTQLFHRRDILECILQW